VSLGALRTSVGYGLRYSTAWIDKFSSVTKVSRMLGRSGQLGGANRYEHAGIHPTPASTSLLDGRCSAGRCLDGAAKSRVWVSSVGSPSIERLYLLTASR